MNRPVSKKALESGKKFRLWGKRNHKGLRRIQALKHVRPEVKPGDIGGWVEYERNLGQDGACWIFDDAEVSECVWVSGDALVGGSALVYGNALIFGYAQVFGSARVYGSAEIYGYARVFAGEWSESPLQIQGSRDFLNISAPGIVTIGCETLSIKDWLEHYREIGKEHGYTKKQIEEYYKYLKLVESLT